MLEFLYVLIFFILFAEKGTILRTNTASVLSVAICFFVCFNMWIGVLEVVVM